MALTFQVGELTARLRRGLILRGRTPFGLDETVVPVVIAADMSQPPYRLDGRSWFYVANSPASVGNLSYVCLSNNGPTDLIVDWISSRTAGQTIGIGVASVAIANGTSQGITTEGLTIANGGPPFFQFLGPVFRSDFNAVSQIAHSFLRIPANGAANPFQRIRLGLVVPSGGQILFEGQTANVALDFDLQGRTFDQSQAVGGR